MMICKRNVFVVLILIFLTCGLYGLVWQYLVSKEISMSMEDSKLSPGIDLFFRILCFPYCIYWYYKYGKAIAALEEAHGIKPNDNSVLFLILSLLGFAIVNVIISQVQLNEIADRQQI